MMNDVDRYRMTPNCETSDATVLRMIGQLQMHTREPFEKIRKCDLRNHLTISLLVFIRRCIRSQDEIASVLLMWTSGFGWSDKLVDYGYRA